MHIGAIIQIQRMIDLNRINNKIKDLVCLHNIQISITKINQPMIFLAGHNNNMDYHRVTLEYHFIKMEHQRMAIWAQGNYQIQDYK